MKTITKWRLAEPLFAKRIAAGMAADRALALLGMSLSREGKLESAAEVFGASVELAPEDASHWTNYGVILDRLNQTQQAIVCLERAVSLAPQLADAWVLLGVARRKLGDLPGASVACQKAVELAPDQAAGWECLGLVKEAQFDYAGAIDCLVTRSKLGAVNGALMALLGKLNYQLGRIDAACEACGQAVELEPASGDYSQMYRRARFMKEMRDGEVSRAIEQFQAECQRSGAAAEHEVPAALKGAFALFSAFGPREAAVRAGKKLLEFQPGNAEVEYLLRAVSGDGGLDRSPAKFVAEHFDGFAAEFDSQLVGALGYDIPKKIGAAIRELAPGRMFDSVLDAGCGTGLCGPVLRPLARALGGIDLSPKMIEQAAMRGGYDYLECAEVVEFLERNPRRFDLVSAADVLVYIGDLDRLFAGAAKAMVPGGILALSTERWTGQGYQLRPSGRFAHAPEYVRRTAVKSGFGERLAQKTTVRLEGTARIPGDVYLFELAR